MKWLAYIGWFVAWFLVHSFLFVPALKGSDNAIITGLIAAINVLLFLGGFYLISKQFSKRPARSLAVTWKQMNDRQIIIIFVGACLIVVMSFFPPFQFLSSGGVIHDLGYGFLLDPPTYQPLVDRTGIAEKYGVVADVPVTGTINLGLLIVQWFAVVLATGVSWRLAKHKG